MYTVKCKGGKPGRKPYPLPMLKEIHTETSSLRTLKIKPRNLKEIVGSWIRLLCSISPLEEARWFKKTKVLVAWCHSFFYFFSFSFIHTIHSHILTSMNIRRGSSPFPHRWTAQWQTPPWVPRRVGIRTRRAGVLPTEPCRTLNWAMPHPENLFIILHCYWTIRSKWNPRRIRVAGLCTCY